jgi:UDP-N-acetylmuramyl pentapeptide synthase
MPLSARALSFSDKLKLDEIAVADEKYVHGLNSENGRAAAPCACCERWFHKNAAAALTAAKKDGILKASSRPSTGGSSGNQESSP